MMQRFDFFWGGINFYLKDDTFIALRAPWNKPLFSERHGIDHTFYFKLWGWRLLRRPRGGKTILNFVSIEDIAKIYSPSNFIAREVFPTVPAKKLPTHVKLPRKKEDPS